MHVFPSPRLTEEIDFVVLFETQIIRSTVPHRGLIEDLYAEGNSIQVEVNMGDYPNKNGFFNDEPYEGAISQIEFKNSRKLSDTYLWNEYLISGYPLEVNYYFSNSSIKIYDNPNNWDIVIITGLEKDFAFLKESLMKDGRKRPANFHLRSTDFKNVFECWDGVAPLDVFNHMKKNVLNHYASKLV